MHTMGRHNEKEKNRAQQKSKGKISLFNIYCHIPAHTPKIRRHIVVRIYVARRKTGNRWNTNTKKKREVCRPDAPIIHRFSPIRCISSVRSVPQTFRLYFTFYPCVPRLTESDIAWELCPGRGIDSCLAAMIVPIETCSRKSTNSKGYEIDHLALRDAQQRLNGFHSTRSQRQPPKTRRRLAEVGSVLFNHTRCAHVAYTMAWQKENNTTTQ